MSLLPLEVAGVRVDLAGDLEARPVHAAFGRFVRDAGEAQLTLVLRADTDVLLADSPPIVEVEGRWRLEGLERLGELDLVAGAGTVSVDPRLVTLDAFLRAYLSREVLARGGVLVHASAPRVDGRAHLCPGRSGAGKSTLAALARDAVADEIAAVLPRSEGGFYVHGTPWWQGRPVPAPLAALYTLAWDREAVDELPRTGGLRHLATNLVLPIARPPERAAAFAAAGRIAAAVPFRRLSFRRDSDVDAIVRGASQGLAA